jgi:hypothetical protein
MMKNPEQRIPMLMRVASSKLKAVLLCVGLHTDDRFCLISLSLSLACIACSDVCSEECIVCS